MIGVCGYSWTGSGAILDLLSEFDLINVIDNTEFILLYYPDGIEDLEFHIMKEFSKYASSTVAIERFRRFIYIYIVRKAKKYDLDKEQIIKLTNKYIDDITQVRWRGFGTADNVLFCGQFYKKVNFRLDFRSFMIRILKYPQKVFDFKWNFYPLHFLELSVYPEQFDKVTKRYINDVLKVFGTVENKINVLDQPFAANDPVRCFKYFDEPYAIVVDRDPRDVYLFMKIYLKGQSGQIPCDDVENFVEYYIRVRQRKNVYSKEEKERILEIRFEDLIYDYENSVNKIRVFCRLKKQNRKKEKFDPMRSINNTQLFKRIKGYESDIQYIESKLSMYLYPFERYKEPVFNGEVFI